VRSARNGQFDGQHHVPVIVSGSQDGAFMEECGGAVPTSAGVGANQRRTPGSIDGCRHRRSARRNRTLVEPDRAIEVCEGTGADLIETPACAGDAPS